MMEKKTDRSAGRPGTCIPPENLSAELDGEYEFSAEERTHLEQCPRCRDLYASYRVIDDAVSRVMTVNCSAAAVRRIRKNVNRELDQMAPMRSHEHIRFYALAARVAAAVVIAAMAFYLIFIDSPYSDDPDDLPPRCFRIDISTSRIGFCFSSASRSSNAALFFSVPVVNSGSWIQENCRPKR